MNYPVPPDAPIEGGPGSDGDRHVLVVDPVNKMLYEMFYSFPIDDGQSWECASGAVFDLTSNELRPDYWTSADAAGLPIFPGLVRYDECVGEGGGDWYISGAPDPRWSDDDLHTLGQLEGGDFEAVDTGPIIK